MFRRPLGRSRLLALTMKPSYSSKTSCSLVRGFAWAAGFTPLFFRRIS